MDEFVIVVEGAKGGVEERIERTSAGGRPAVGDYIRLGDQDYRVYRALYQDDPTPAVRLRGYQSVELFVRRVGRSELPPPPLTPRPVDDDLVLPLVRALDETNVDAETAIFPPEMVGLLVACGYRAQATHFEVAKRVVARLIRAGEGWILQDVTRAECRRLSRRAKRGFAVTCVFLAALSAARGLSDDLPEEPQAPSLDEFDEEPTQPRSSPRGSLRLVRSE